MNSTYIWNSPCLLQSFHLSWIITTRRSPWPFHISAMFAWLPAFQIIQNTSKALTHHQHLLGPHTGVVKQKQLPKKYCYLTNVSRKKASKHIAWRVVSYGFFRVYDQNAASPQWRWAIPSTLLDGLNGDFPVCLEMASALHFHAWEHEWTIVP